MASTNARPAPARAGVPGAMQIAKTKAARNPPRLGRERSLSFAALIVSGIQTCPRNASGVRHAVRESGDFTPKGNRAERVQIVNGGWKWASERHFYLRMTFSENRYPLFGVMRYFDSARFTMSSTLMRLSAVEN